MSDDLYQKAIIDLAKRSRELGRLEQPDRSATVDNPLCGDRITLDLTLDGETVERVGHKTRGCLLCEASAGLNRGPRARSDAGRPGGEGRGVDPFVQDEDQALDELWPSLETLAPARRYKSRLECVTLPFSALFEGN